MAALIISVTAALDNFDICCHHLRLELAKTMKIIVRLQNCSILMREMPDLTIKS